jgi:hypothetical protein
MSEAIPLAERRARGAKQFRTQEKWCRAMGSPIYAGLLAAAADDCAAGGPTWDVIEGREDMSEGDVLAIRFAGSVHRLVLEGRAPGLARFYPSAGGAEPGDAWPAFRDVLAAHTDELRGMLARPVQTNEVARSGSLLGGFAQVARETGLPLRLLEVGTSAGLNLRFDRFSYESEGFAWGDPASGVRLRNVFEGRAPAIAERIAVADRMGCDAAPIDPTSDEGKLTLRTWLWPDQVERRTRLDAALEIAARVPAKVVRADACDFTERELVPARGVATVVFHSVVAGYLGAEKLRRFAGLIAAAGARASADAPIAHVCLEPRWSESGEWQYCVFLRLWPGDGEQRVLALTSPHGPPVRWLAA